MATRDSGTAVGRRARWRELVRRWRGSGLSQAAFCRRHGLHVWQLSWWKKQLEAEPSPAFVPVEVVAPTEARVELRLRGGRWLRFPATLDAATLSGLVTAVEGVGVVDGEADAC